MTQKDSNNGKRPKLLTVLSPSPTHPDNFGNRKRIKKVCEAFQARGYDISFLFFPLDGDWREEYSPRYLREMRDAWGEVELIIPSRDYHPASSELDHGIDEWWDPSISTYLNWYFRTHRPDAFMVNYTYLSHALDYVPNNCVKILDTHDKFGGRRELLETLGLEPEFFHTSVEDEAKGISRADIVVAIKEHEEEYFKSLCDKTVVTIPYFEDNRELEPNRQHEGYLKVGIIGARNNINYKNVSRFLDEALPLFKSYMAPIEIVLAGGMCKDLDAYENNSYVKLLGYVDDVNEFYEQLDMVAVPMEISSGQKIKVGEALSTGLPMISHAHAYEGYKTESAYHLQESFEEMAKTLLHLSFSPEKLSCIQDDTCHSFKEQKEYFNKSIETLDEKIKSLKSTGLFVVDAGMLSASPALQAYLITMTGISNSLFSTCLVIDGPLTETLTRFLKKVSRQSNIYVNTDSLAVDLHTIKYLENPEKIFDLFNVRFAWCFSDFLADSIYAHHVPTLVSPEFGDAFSIQSVVASNSTGCGADVLAGDLIKDDNGYALDNCRVITTAVFDDEDIKAVLPNKLGNPDGQAAVFASLGTIDWLPATLKLLRRLDKQITVYCAKEELAQIQEKLSALFSVEKSIRVTTPDKEVLSAEVILDFCTKSEFASSVEMCRAAAAQLSKGSVCVWRFPRTYEIRPLQLLNDIQAYVEGTGEWKHGKGNRLKDSHGFEFLYNFMKSRYLNFM